MSIASRSALILCGHPLQACKLDPSSSTLVPNATVPLRSRLFHCVRQQYDELWPQSHAVPQLFGVCRASCFLASIDVHDADQTLVDPETLGAIGIGKSSAVKSA